MQNSHRTIQHFLKESLAPQEVWLEKSFPQIHRIADVVWPEQNIIFEVQYSPLSAREIQARNRDYEKVGYSVIWILHDRHYNREYLTPAERYLRHHSHFFTNINALGHGEIYDQHAYVRFGRRIKRTPRYPLNLNRCLSLKQIPRHFPKERRKWKFSFEGDLLHQEYQPLEQSPFFPYRALFHILLKPKCH